MHPAHMISSGSYLFFRLKDNIFSLNFVLGSEDDLTVKEMERLFGKVDEMRTQRQMLGEQFRDQVHTDDITTTLVTREEVSQEVRV